MYIYIPLSFIGIYISTVNDCAQYFCVLGVYGDLYVERPRCVFGCGGWYSDEYLADHPEEQVQEHQVLRLRV